MRRFSYWASAVIQGAGLCAVVVGIVWFLPKSLILILVGVALWLGGAMIQDWSMGGE